MGFIKISCHSCGGDVELSEDKESGVCTYCSSKITRDKILVKHSGNISVNGLANDQTLIERAFLFLENHNFTKAKTYFERVLDINPHCSKAYIGELMCKLQVTSIKDLELNEIPLQTYQEYSLALRFATPEEFATYSELNKKTLDNSKSKKRIFGQEKQFNKPNTCDTQTETINNYNNIYDFRHKPKNKWIALLLCVFTFCGHKFYEGKIGMGFIYLFTCGLFGIGWLIDIITLLSKPNTYYVN